MWTKKRGSVNELQCMAKIAEYGYTVLTPYGDSERYDFVIEKGGKFQWVQCKTWHQVEGRSLITISLKSSHITANGTVTKLYTEDEIELFATFFNGECYLIPVSQVKKMKLVSLSVDENKKAKRYLSYYLASKILDNCEFNGIVPVYKVIEKNRNFERKEKPKKEKIGKFHKVDKEQFKKDLVEMSPRKVAYKYGVSCCTIQKWIAKLNFEIPESAKTKIRAEAAKKNDHSKPVVQLTKGGEYLRTFKSIRDASKFVATQDTHIFDCLSGRRKTHRKSRWMYLSDFILDRGRTGHAPDFGIGVAPQKCDDENGANSTNSARADNDELSGDEPKCVETIHPAPDCMQG